MSCHASFIVTACGRWNSSHIVDPIFDEQNRGQFVFVLKVLSFYPLNLWLGLQKPSCIFVASVDAPTPVSFFISQDHAHWHTGAVKNQRTRRRWVLLTADRWLYQWLPWQSWIVAITSHEPLIQEYHFSLSSFLCYLNCTPWGNR